MMWLARAREALKGVLFRRREDAEMQAEMRFHLEMEAERLVRAGVAPAEARRQAAIAFGGEARAQEEVRAARGLAWLGGLSLDLKLGLRMLLKYPGLTLVGTVGMAVAIAIGATFFAMIDGYILPSLPLEDGERVVAIESNDAKTGREWHILHDFAEWRTSLESVTDLSAYRGVRRNLVAADGSARTVHIAEMTASAFDVARARPLFGRVLTEEDELPGAPPVVVIGHDAWQSLFSGDANVLGRVIRLGQAEHRVVGVMPQGFRFPVSFSFWIPLRAQPRDYARREGPDVFVFGRLAGGATQRSAAAELATLGRQAAAAYPATHAELTPRIVPFTTAFSPISPGPSRWPIYLLQVVISMVLVLVAVNVAILVYARTATRAGEIAVRGALGASRRRIVSQLFMEALVLSALAAVVGLAIARAVLAQFDVMMTQLGEMYGGMPFWIEGGLTLKTGLYVVGMTMLGAAIAGAVPALKATGRQMQSNLRQVGGSTQLQLGRTWTLLIILQVMVAVMLLPGTVFTAWDLARVGFAQPGFDASQYLTAYIEQDREVWRSASAAQEQRAFEQRYQQHIATLRARLEAEPGVTAVAFASDVPGHEAAAPVEIAGVAGPAVHSARYTRVDDAFFAAFDTDVLAGRGFTTADLDTAAATIIVSRTFVEEALGGGNALGQRIRYTSTESWADAGVVEVGRWYEIVGVVADLPPNALEPAEAMRVYHPLRPGAQYPALAAVRLRGMDASGFARRLHAITASVDPTLRPHEAMALDLNYAEGEQRLSRMGAVAVALLTLSVLLLSAAGMYALMSFTVTRRRREIGIRAALGADPRSILLAIFSRALGQVGIGVAIGAVLATLILRSLTGANLLRGHGVVILPSVAALMILVGVLAALGPARRGLRIQPTEALKGD